MMHLKASKELMFFLKTNEEIMFMEIRWILNKFQDLLTLATLLILSIPIKEQEVSIKLGIFSMIQNQISS